MAPVVVKSVPEKKKKKKKKTSLHVYVGMWYVVYASGQLLTCARIEVLQGLSVHSYSHGPLGMKSVQARRVESLGLRKDA